METSLSFGISTTVLREHPVSYALERIAMAGYSSAEIWPWHLERWGERSQEIKNLVNDLGLRLTMHAPAEGLNPISLDIELAGSSRRQITESLHLAVVLGAEVIAVHPGRRDSLDEALDDAWMRMLDWVVELEARASNLNLRIGLELMEKLPLEIFMTPRDAARLMEMQFDHVGITVDIAHMNTHMNPVNFLEQIQSEWINHVHLADNAPHRVHLPLGEGQIDIGGVLTDLSKKYQGIVSIEGSVSGQGEALLAGNLSVLRKLGWV
jgi:sugar phosphate isomerase/epimerase